MCHSCRAYTAATPSDLVVLSSLDHRPKDKSQDRSPHAGKSQTRVLGKGTMLVVVQGLAPDTPATPTPLYLDPHPTTGCSCACACWWSLSFLLSPLARGPQPPFATSPPGSLARAPQPSKNPNSHACAGTRQEAEETSTRCQHTM